jgi:hypothetical protein
MSGTATQEVSMTNRRLAILIASVFLFVASASGGDGGLGDHITLGSKPGIASGSNVIEMGAKPGIASGSNIVS